MISVMLHMLVWVPAPSLCACGVVVFYWNKMGVVVCLHSSPSHLLICASAMQHAASMLAVYK